MKAFSAALPLLLAVSLFAAPGAHAADPAPVSTMPAADLSRVKLSDDDKAAMTGLLDWLTGRGMEVSIKGGTVVYRRGLLLNITPLMSNGEIDRLLFRVYYNPEDKFRGKPEFAEMAAGLNAAQNALQVFVDLIKQYVLKESVVEMLK